MAQPSLRSAVSLGRGLLTSSTQPTADGSAGDQASIAPAFMTPDREFGMLAERFGATARAVESWPKTQLVISQVALAVPARWRRYRNQHACSKTAGLCEKAKPVRMSEDLACGPDGGVGQLAGVSRESRHVIVGPTAVVVCET